MPTPSNLRLLLLISNLWLLSACASRIQVFEYPTQQEHHLAQMQTYCWAEPDSQSTMENISPTGGHHRDFDTTVRAAINEALQTKGFQSAPCSSAGFLIDYRMGIHEDVASADASTEDSLHDYGMKWSIGTQADVHYEGLSQPEEIFITVRHGTLHIAAFTPQGKVLWHSSAEKTLNERESESTRLKTIRQATEKTMASFPAQH